MRVNWKYLDHVVCVLLLWLVGIGLISYGINWQTGAGVACLWWVVVLIIAHKRDSEYEEEFRKYEAERDAYIKAAHEAAADATAPLKKAR